MTGNGIKKRFCDVAIATAGLSNHHFSVGSVIVKGNRIISLGINQIKTHPILIKKFYNRTLTDKLHSEMSALLRAKTDMAGAKMYVARKKLKGLGMAFPCSMCMSMIREAGIKQIIYTGDDGLWHIDKVS